MAGKAFSGGDKLAERLKEIAAKVSGADTLNVGFLAGATYPDGTPVAQIAATNEYGGTVTIPAHDVTIYRKKDKNGKFSGGKLDKEGNRVGATQFVKKSKSNFETTHSVEEHTVTIPSRPFFRGMIQKNQAQWPKDLGKIIKAADYDAGVSLARLGYHIAGQLQQSIRDLKDPPNAKSTLAQKKGSNPLVDTGHMLNSVDFEVQE